MSRHTHGTGLIRKRDRVLAVDAGNNVYVNINLCFKATPV